MADREAWAGSTRRSRLPANWAELRAAADLRNPRRVCHWCGRPGGSDLDHKKAGDDHRPENLDWIHGLRSLPLQRQLGLTPRNCHAEKSGQEGAAARPRENRQPEVHPALK